MRRFEPQRHRDTEFAQSCFLNSPQPRRHEDTKESQSPSACLKPQITQIDADIVAIWISSPFTPTPLEYSNDNERPTDHTDQHRCIHPFQKRRDAETQRCREDDTDILCVARFRPSDGREPLGLESASKTSIRIGFQTQRLAIRKRKPRHLFSINGWKDRTPSPIHRNGERQNRRAPGTAAGGKWDVDGRSRPEAAQFSPATGDPIACRSAVGLQHHLSSSASLPLRLCASASLRFKNNQRVTGSASICVICVICGQTVMSGV